MKTTEPMLEYLASCSKTSLQSFRLARLNDRAILREQIIELMDELVEADIQARIAEWFLVRGRQQIGMRRRSPRPSSTELKNLSLPLLPPNRDADDDGADLPTVGTDPMVSALRNVAIELLRATPRNATLMAERSRRIA